MKKLLAFILAVPVFGAYTHVRPVVVPAKYIPATQTNFTATFAGTYFYLASTANGGGVTSGSGFDIIFTSDAGCTTKLNFERAAWSGTTGQSEFHIEIPSLSSTADTTIYLCYGNSAITTDQSNPTATWPGAVDVNHFGAVGSLSNVDSTGTTTFTPAGSPTSGRGEISGSILTHSATSDLISGANAPLQSSGSKTFEAWVNPQTFQTSAANTGIVTYGKVGSGIYSLFVQNDGTGINRTPTFGFADSMGNFPVVTGPVLHVGKFYHLVGVIDTGINTLSLYMNGNLIKSSPFTLAPAAGDSSMSLFVGRDFFAATNPQSYWNGAVDEVRVSNVVRSAAWIKIEYENLSDPQSFYVVGPEMVNSSNFSNINVDATNTQAVITFTYSADPSACHVDVSESSSLFPLVNDTNPAMFTNADSVTRDSANSVTGHTVKFVVGKRYQAFYALDGNRQSRALQQNTPFYWQASCNSGTDIYAGTLRTTPIGMGDTHLDSIPSDPASPGYPLWPTPTGFQRCNTFDLGCSTLRRNTTYIDPQTGVQIRHLRMPDDVTIADTNVQTMNGWVMGTGWTIPAGWNTSSTLQATITASTNPLVIGNWENIGGGVGSSAAFGSGDVQTADGGYHVPVALQDWITASVGNGACTAGNTNPDCAMQVCVTTNWQTCATNAQTFTQFLTTTPTQYTFGSGQPYDVMQVPGKRIWSQADSGWRPDQVTCTGTNTVTRLWTNGTIPPEQDPVGSYLNIQGLGPQQITGSISALQFTIGPTCPSGTWNINGSAFGILTWKETSSADTLTLSNSFISDIAGLDKNPQYNSGFYGTDFSVTLANGDPAGIVQMLSGQYSIDLLNGKVGAFMPETPIANVNAALQSASFDSSGNYWVVGNDKSLTKYVYQGDYATPIDKTGHPELPLWQFNAESSLPTCGGQVTNQCFQTPTTITLPGQTLDVLLTAFDSRYSTNPFGQWFFTDIELGKLIFDIRWSGSPGQNYWGWVMVFDPQATSNANGAFGAGCVGQNTNPAGPNYLTPGCIVGARRAWDGYGARWMTEKEVGQMLQPGWMSVEETVSTFGSTPGGGPAVANKTSTYGTTAACPTNPYSLTTCITFTVDGDPFDFIAGTSSRGVLGTYMIGDQAILAIDDITYPNPPGGPSIKTNTVNLLQLVGISGTSLTFGCVYGPSQCAPTDINPQMLWMYSSFPAFNYPWSTGPNGEGMVDIVAWDFADDPHGTNSGRNTIIWDYATSGSHGFNGNAQFSQGGTNNQTLCTVNQSCYNNQNFQGLSNAAFVSAMLTQNYNNVTGLVALSSSFAGLQGFNGACGNDNCQTHPDYSKLGSGNLSNYGIDGRPFVGISCIPCTSDISRVGSSGTLYKVANVTYLHQRTFDTSGTTARRVLKNISEPGSTITNGSGDNYKMCIVLIANECVSGSSIGDVYVNIPFNDFAIPSPPNSGTGTACYFPPSGFAGNQSDNWTINDLCLYDSGMETQSYTRYALGTFDSQGASEQTLGHLFSPARLDIFTGIHPATNINASTYDQYYFFTAQAWDDVFAQMVLKAPPANLDSKNRTTFQGLPVNIHQISGADHAAIEFGYSEYGSNLFECSPNRANDPCVAYAATVNLTTPFSWESETPSPLSCASTCTIAIPALPEHVVYWRPVYYSGSSIVGRGPTQISLVQ